MVTLHEERFITRRTGRQVILQVSVRSILQGQVQIETTCRCWAERRTAARGRSLEPPPRLGAAAEPRTPVVLQHNVAVRCVATEIYKTVLSIVRPKSCHPKAMRTTEALLDETARAAGW